MTYKIQKRYLDYTGKIIEQILITKIPTATLANNIVAVLEQELDLKPFDDTKIIVLAD